MEAIKIKTSILNGEECRHGLTVEGSLESGERFYIRFGGYKNKGLVSLLNSRGGKYNPDVNYMSIDTSIYSGEDCWRFPQNPITRLEWLKLLGWRDMGGRYEIESLQEYTAENIKNFLQAIGANVEKVEILEHK